MTEAGGAGEISLWYDLAEGSASVGSARLELTIPPDQRLTLRKARVGDSAAACVKVVGYEVGLVDFTTGDSSHVISLERSPTVRVRATLRGTAPGATPREAEDPATYFMVITSGPQRLDDDGQPPTRLPSALGVPMGAAQPLARWVEFTRPEVDQVWIHAQLAAQPGDRPAAVQSFGPFERDVSDVEIELVERPAQDPLEALTSERLGLLRIRTLDATTNLPIARAYVAPKDPDLVSGARSDEHGGVVLRVREGATSFVVTHPLHAGMEFGPLQVTAGQETLDSSLHVEGADGRRIKARHAGIRGRSAVFVAHFPPPDFTLGPWQLTGGDGVRVPPLIFEVPVSESGEPLVIRHRAAQ